MPDVSRRVFHRASLKNTSGSPLLAGPVTLLEEDAYASVGDIAYVREGERFDLSFGTDDRFFVRLCRRRLEEERTLGKDRLHFVREVEFAYSGSEEERVLVLLRMPKSEVKQVKVVPSEKHCGEGRPEPDEHGIVRLPLTLAPGERRELSLGFLFETSSDVVLPDPW